MPDLIPFLVFCFNCPGSYLMYRHLETRPGARGPQNGNEPIATARQFVAHSGISEWHKKWKSSELLLFRWFIEKCKDNSFIVSILVIWISFAPLTRQIHQLTSLKGIQLYIINPFYIAHWHVRADSTICSLGICNLIFDLRLIVSSFLVLLCTPIEHIILEWAFCYALWIFFLCHTPQYLDWDGYAIQYWSTFNMHKLKRWPYDSLEIGFAS